jgi:hypothetical protein
MMVKRDKKSQRLIGRCPLQMKCFTLSVGVSSSRQCSTSYATGIILWVPEACHLSQDRESISHSDAASHYDSPRPHLSTYVLCTVADRSHLANVKVGWVVNKSVAHLQA